GRSGAARRPGGRTCGSPTACARARSAPPPRGTGSWRCSGRGSLRAAGRAPPRCSAEPATRRTDAWLLTRSAVAGEEDEAVLADLHLVAALQRHLVDPVAVDVGAVEAADVGDGEPFRRTTE